jgi:hypothetical protein
MVDGGIVPPGDGGYGAGSDAGGTTYFGPAYTTNALWLQINGATNYATDCGTNWTAGFTIFPPWNDTNQTWDLLYTTNLDPPIDWSFLMRCINTNVVVSNLNSPQEFFILTHTNGDLTVSTNSTAEQLAQLLVPSGVTIYNATFTGSNVARGTFAGGNGCGLPIDSGVILSTGCITNALGPNDDDGSIASDSGSGPSCLNLPGDADLDTLVCTFDCGERTWDAAVLEFDIISTNSFTLQFQYVYASEEYPEWISGYNDPMAIFVSTNFDGTNWLNGPTNDFALVPGTTNVPVNVSTINGGCSQEYISPTNPQYYVDNHDPDYSAMSPYAAPAGAFNIQYDGMTVLLTAQIPITAGVTNHVKIGVEDYDDDEYDSAVFITAAQIPCD